MILNSISNGLGSQSMYLLVLAARGEIPATVSITADTGSENDRLWNTGERTTAREYFDRVVMPYAAKHGVESRFVRAVDTAGEMPSLFEHTRQMIQAGKLTGIKIPLFGSRGGRLGQSCTGRWKIAAIKQEARRRGAVHLRTAQGIHYGEADRRVKGIYLRNEGEWSIYQDTVRRNGKDISIKWCTHYYPLVDRRLKRNDAVAALVAEGIPYLISSECDMCPHQDLARWERHTPESLAQTAEMEALLEGQFFFTDERVPLLEAIARKRERSDSNPEIDFGCGNSYCGI